MEYIDHDFFETLYIAKDGVYWEESKILDKGLVRLTMLVDDPRQVNTQNLDLAARLIKNMEKIIRQTKKKLPEYYEQHPASPCWEYYCLAYPPESSTDKVAEPQERPTVLEFLMQLQAHFIAVNPTAPYETIIMDLQHPANIMRQSLCLYLNKNQEILDVSIEED